MSGRDESGLTPSAQHGPAHHALSRSAIDYVADRADSDRRCCDSRQPLSNCRLLTGRRGHNAREGSHARRRGAQAVPIRHISRLAGDCAEQDRGRASLGRAAVTGRRSDGRGAVRHTRCGRGKAFVARRVCPEQC
ncbi:hypothetical protein DF047_25400 [Burkholderia cenocepacia]|nr:hypothetical protein DF047_25400 [Burkholderia cenocepacia]